jgi:hypothetical protein
VFIARADGVPFTRRRRGPRGVRVRSQR